MIIVNYNNQDLFSGISPIPLFSLEESPTFFQNRWCLTDKIIFEGQITGICGGFSGIKTKQQELVSRLSKSMQNLEISQDSEVVYSAPVAKIVNINFDESTWAGVLPYSIELECYISGLHSGFYGVNDPVNEFSFKQNEDGTVDFTHTCEAVGYTTEVGEPLQNAKNYVSSISGWNSQVFPLFVGAPTTGILLKSIEEKVNRFAGSYSLVESYRYDPNNPIKGILRYAVSLDSGIEGIVSASIDGNIEGGKNTSLSDLRAIYSGTSFYDRANELYSGVYSGVLNQNPTSFTFDENSFAKNIDFSVSYDNSSHPNPYYIDSTQINKVKNGASSLSLDLVFKWRGNCLCQNESGWLQLNNAANNFDLYSFALSKWNQYGKTTSLNPAPISKSKGEDKLNCELSIGAEFEEVLSVPPSGLDSFDYTLSVNPAVPAYSSTTVICEGQYSITDLRYDKRATFTIQGSSRINSCTDQTLGEQLIKNEINRLAAIYVIGSRKILENGSFTQGEGQNQKNINFSYTWSSEAPRVLDIFY